MGKIKMLSQARYFLIELAVVVAIVLAHSYLQLSYALTIDDYISDEVWYVSSARNYLNKVFGVYPRTSSSGLRVTLELSTTSRSDYLDAADRLGKLVRELGGGIVKSSEYYGTGDNPLYAICVDIPEGSLEILLANPYVKSFGVGYCYPNAGNILNYMNLEHPPLGKYLIALSMVVCGDTPTCWRLPSIVSGAGVLVVQYILLRNILRGFWGIVVSILVPVITLLDRTFRSMTLVAMLDAPLALLTLLACFLSLRGSVYASSTSLSLAFSTKFSGVFAVPALYFDYSRKKPPALAILLLVYAPLAVFVVLSIPLILHRGGFLQWWSEAVEGSFRWHLTTKTEPGRGPPAAPPWDWLAGANSFILHYKYEEHVGFVADLVASGNPVLYIATAALSVFALPHLKKLPDGGRSWLYTWLTWLMYVFLWFAGNRSQYSFYMIQLVPLLYGTLGVLVYYLSEVDNARNLAIAWLKMLRNLVRYLRGEIGIRVRVEVEATNPEGPTP
ncbi:MAG: glycosyltransferase family 39 protein [Sulfolobales archaeon]|nr:glycosyltransferase family 39 protein [Sulfolobales archaeon]MCX8208777.1 glycosyltransferase family 39 protein [Sulfolobales archaeon]MDW8010273.1 glycosyltransferase family 39 protein [Sulfolobales archaeon]